jgi:hypothetical protein
MRARGRVIGVDQVRTGEPGNIIHSVNELLPPYSPISQSSLHCRGLPRMLM